jgi:hypothetical protein
MRYDVTKTLYNCIACKLTALQESMKKVYMSSKCNVYKYLIDFFTFGTIAENLSPSYTKHIWLNIDVRLALLSIKLNDTIILGTKIDFASFANPTLKMSSTSA